MAEKKAPSRTLSADVESRLLEYMRVHCLEPGDAIPRELELSENLQVSRHIVREGLSRLKAMGLICSRKRGGTVFCRPDPFIGIQKLAEAGMFNSQEIKNFMEIRVALEIGLCDFIFLRKTPVKLLLLRSLAGRPEQQLYTPQEELAFHTCLMSIADNAAADSFRRMLIMAFSSTEAKKDGKNPPSHLMICDELEHGSMDSFRTIMRKHLVNYVKC